MLMKKSLTLSLLLITLFLSMLSFDYLQSSKTNCETANNVICTSESKAETDNVEIALESSGNKSWTYMLYLDADNDIEGDAIRDFEWLEQAGGSNENISFVVLLDRIPGYDNTHGNWNGSRIYNITEDISPTTIDSQLMVDLGEVDMADQLTLIDFITYCFNNFPAENYILDLWNHGHAAYGVIDDETSSSHFIVNDIQTAISTALDTSNEEIDILSMDACNMATLEVAWEMRNLCKYFITSEDGTNGYPYKLIAERIILDSNINASTLCKLMVDAYSDHYEYIYKTCLSAINQTKLLEIPDLINPFLSELMITLDEGYYDNIFKLSRELSYDFYDGNWIDFISLVDNIIYFLDHPSLNLAGMELLEFLDLLILYNWQHHSYHGNARGVTIFIPSDSIAYELINDYVDGISFCSGMDWLSDTLWDEFLTFYKDNYLYTSYIEPPMLSLDEVEEDCTIQENAIKLYRINIWQNSIYEFYCSISTGDVDIKVIEYDFSGNYELVGGSYLINPTDGSAEFCRFRLETGFYLIKVQCKNLASIFNLVVRKSNFVELVCNSPYTSTGGSMNGDDQGHYKQDLNHYFQIAIPYGNNTIRITNSEFANYQLTIFNELWSTLFFLPAKGSGDVLILMYNHTSENPITIILEVCGYEGVGDFTIEIKNPLEPTPKMTVNIWFFTFFIPIIFAFGKKKNKENN